MKKINLAKVLGVVVFLIGSDSYSETRIIRYEKSLLNQKKIDLSAVFQNGFSEIRWDSNADGIIDHWLVSKDQYQVEMKFKKGLLDSANFYKRDHASNLRITFKAKDANKLVLVESRIFPHRVYNFDTDSDCKPHNLSRFFSQSRWADLIQKTEENDQTSRIQNLIQPSCQKLLGAAKFQQLQEAAQNVFKVNLRDNIESNQFVSCLSKLEDVEEVFPQFLKKLIQVSTEENQCKISCVESDTQICGKASVDSGTCETKLFLPQADCGNNLVNVFEKSLTHEYLHLAGEDRLSEDAIRTIVEQCGQGNHQLKSNQLAMNSLVDSVKLAEIKNEEKATIGSEKTSSMLHNPSAEENRTQAAQSQVANIPVELAAGSVAPNKTLDSTMPAAPLNSGFRESKNQSLGSTQALSQSITRTAPVLAMAQKIFSNAVIPSAQAQSSSSFSGGIASTSKYIKSASRSSRSIASVSSSESKWLAGGEKPAVVSNSGKSDKFDSESPLKAASISNSGAEVVEGTLTEDHSSGSPELALNSGSKKMGNSSSGGQRTVASFGGGAKAQSGTGGAKANVSGQENSEHQKRELMIKNILSLPKTQVWEFIKKNHAQIRNLNIHITDSKYQVWGVPADEASARLREQNGALVRLDR